MKTYTLFFVCMLGFFTGCSSPVAATRAPGDVVTEKGEDESFEEQVARQEEILRQQQMQLDRQSREIENLERQKYHNQNFKPYSK